jgi:glutaminyl-tRNA synthetase
VIQCEEVVKDAAGDIVELHCSYDPATLNHPPAQGPVKGTIHWVSAPHAVLAQMRLYDRLFSVADPEAADGDFTAGLNPDSLAIVLGYVEPSVLKDSSEIRYQFERLGYFWRDPVDSRPANLVFTRIVSLRDSWAKREASKKS